MQNEILIAYYSWKGNTRKIAELIQQATGGALFEIEPVQPYSRDYNAVVAQAKTEIRAGFRPELKAMPEGDSPSVVFLGTPIWWYTMAPPLAALIDRYALGGKTVAPFYTHGGGGPGTLEADIRRMCPDSPATDNFGVHEDGGSGAASQVSAWLRILGLKK